MQSKSHDLPTPSLLLDLGKMERNIARLAGRLPAAVVKLRPHLKTTKCIEIASLILKGREKSITVSTLKEAQVFGRAGILDILYAVQITPQKLQDVTAIRKTGVDLKILVDTDQAAQAVSDHAAATGDRIPCLIEVDIDGHRGGISLEAKETLLSIGRILDKGARLAGIMTHAGDSYNLSDYASLRAAAESERRGAVQAADCLRAGGLSCEIVSIGSSPTAHALDSFEGITEIRAGVYVFGDLVQSNIGVCDVDDIAISVLASVIGHQPQKGWIITDCGWTALSSDRGQPGQAIDYGYGQVCDENGCPLDDLIVLNVNQEHGIIGLRPGANGHLPALPVGSRVRILPNHACAAAHQHQAYNVIRGSDVIDAWPRFRGWTIDSAGNAPKADSLIVLDHKTVAAASSRNGAFSAVANAFKAMADGCATAFPVVNALVEAPETAFSIKAGVDHQRRLTGLKIGAYWPENQARFNRPNHNSTTLLLDYETGAPRALVNAQALNGLRTAAANAVATNALARLDAHVLLVIGAGHQARYEVRALCDVRPIEQLVIWARDRSAAERMASELADLGIEMIVADDPVAAARRADLITTVTKARKALLPADAIRPGVHISAMGADMVGKQELDPEILRQALLFADWPAQSARIGEFQHVCGSGLRASGDIVAIGEVLAGRHPGRKARDAITVFDSSGVAIQDIYVAGAVLDAVLASDTARQFSF